MIRKILLICLIPLALLAAFAHPDEQASETRDVAPFTTVSVGQSISVVLKPGPEPKVVVNTGGKAEPQDVSTEVSGNRLRVAMAHNVNGRAYIEVIVYYQQLEEVKASSSSEVAGASVIHATDFMVDVSSSAKISVQLDVESLRVDASSSGDAIISVKAKQIFAEASSSGSISIDGRTDKLVVDTSSGADFHGYGLETEEATLESSSGSGIEVTVNERLGAEASSGASIRYRGHPEHKYVKERSGGSIQSRN